MVWIAPPNRMEAVSMHTRFLQYAFNLVLGLKTLGPRLRNVRLKAKHSAFPNLLRVAPMTTHLAGHVPLDNAMDLRPGPLTSYRVARQSQRAPKRRGAPKKTTTHAGMPRQQKPRLNRRDRRAAHQKNST